MAQTVMSMMQSIGLESHLEEHVQNVIMMAINNTKSGLHVDRLCAYVLRDEVSPLPVLWLLNHGLNLQSVIFLAYSCQFLLMLPVSRPS